MSGASLLSAGLSNRVARLTYSPGTNTNTVVEQITFMATDPTGLSSSNAATFVVLPNQPPVVSPIPG